MSEVKREAALARLQARRQQFKRELARVEREMARRRREVLSIEERLAVLLPNQRTAA